MKHQLPNMLPWLVCPTCGTEMLQLSTDEDPAELFKEGTRIPVMVCATCSLPSVVDIREKRVHPMTVEDVKNVCLHNSFFGRQLLTLMLQLRPE